MPRASPWWRNLVRSVRIHVKCSGLPSKKDYTDGFVCTHCISASEITAAKQTPEEPPITHRDAQSFWSTITDEKAALLALYYGETVHWKPKLLSLRKNKAGHDFIQTLNVIFTELVDRGQHSTYAMKIAMVMPHLLQNIYMTPSRNSINIWHPVKSQTPCDVWTKHRRDKY